MTMDSLSPFQVPRRSGMADSAAAGAAASATNVTIQASFDMTGAPPRGSIAALLKEDSIERGRMRQDSRDDDLVQPADTFTHRCRPPHSFSVQPPYRDQGADGRQQKQP